MFERLDQSARHVLEIAGSEAASLEDDAVCTQHLLLALATADSVTARLLAEAAAARPTSAESLGASEVFGPGRDVITTRSSRRSALTWPRSADERSGPSATTRSPAPRYGPDRGGVAGRFGPGSPAASLYPRRRCDSPLTGERPYLIPRVKRVLDRATRAARPRLASPSHMLLALIAGNEPACEVLADLGVDLDALGAATRRCVDEAGTERERAS